jgi:hypothetical protein
VSGDVPPKVQAACLRIFRQYAQRLALHATDSDADVRQLREQMRQTLGLIDRELDVNR